MPKLSRMRFPARSHGSESGSAEQHVADASVDVLRIASRNGQRSKDDRSPAPMAVSSGGVPPPARSSHSEFAMTNTIRS